MTKWSKWNVGFICLSRNILSRGCEVCGEPMYVKITLFTHRSSGIGDFEIKTINVCPECFKKRFYPDEDIPDLLVQRLLDKGIKVG